MKSQKLILQVAKGYVLLSAVSVLAVSVMAFQSPQAVMDLVSVKLTTNDAFSSIRGVYGGVGVTLFIALIYTLRKNISESLGLLVTLWGLYAASRLMTIFTEGPLGNFGNKWLAIEVTFCFIAVILLVSTRRIQAKSIAEKRIAHSRKSIQEGL